MLVKSASNHIIIYKHLECKVTVKIAVMNIELGWVRVYSLLKGLDWSLVLGTLKVALKLGWVRV